MRMGVAVPPLASPLVKGTVNLGGLENPEEGGDHGPLQARHRSPENLSEERLKVGRELQLTTTRTMTLMGCGTGSRVSNERE